MEPSDSSITLSTANVVSLSRNLSDEIRPPRTPVVGGSGRWRLDVELPGVNMRLRDPSSWITSDDLDLKPIASPIAPHDMQNRVVHTTREGVVPSIPEPGKVKALASVFDKKANMDAIQLGREGIRSEKPKTIGRVKQLVSTFSQAETSQELKSQPRISPRAHNGNASFSAKDEVFKKSTRRPVIVESQSLGPVSSLAKMFDKPQTAPPPIESIKGRARSQEVHMSPLLAQKIKEAVQTEIEKVGEDDEGFQDKDMELEEFVEEMTPMQLDTDGFLDVNMATSILSPMRPPGDMTKPWKDFYQSLREILTNEHTFVKKWHLANRFFIDPLLNKLGEERTLRFVPLQCWYNIFRFHDAILGDLFESVAELWGAEFARFDRPSLSLELKELIPKSAQNVELFSTKLKKMEEREQSLNKSDVQRWFLKVNRVMISHSDILAIAREFIIHYPSAINYFEVMSDKKKELIAELETAPELDHLQFRDVLILPVQNVCRYHLLYKAVVDKAPETELVEHARLAQDKLALLAQRMNEAMRSADRKSAEALLQQLRADNSDTFVGRFISKGFLFSSRQSGMAEASVNLHDVMTVPLREGSMTIVSVRDLNEDEKVNLPDSLSGKGQVRGLLCMNQLLLVDGRRRSTPEILHSFSFSSGLQSLRVDEDPEKDQVLHLILEGDDGQMEVTFEVDDRQGWLRDFREVSKAIENSRQRELAAQQQLAKKRSSVQLSAV